MVDCGELPNLSAIGGAIAGVAAGVDNTCGKRFGWQLGSLPAGYDHKYIYSHVGYNLKPLDVQAAIGREQLKRLDDFTAVRCANHAWLLAACKPYEEFSDLAGSYGQERTLLVRLYC